MTVEFDFIVSMAEDREFAALVASCGGIVKEQGRMDRPATYPPRYVRVRTASFPTEADAAWCILKGTFPRFEPHTD